MVSKKIAVLVETSLDSGRQIVRGISRFARERNDWALLHHTGPLGAMVPASLENWAGDGIIARVANPKLHELVKRLKVPVVDVLGNVPETEYPLVKSDDAAIAQLVGNHFKDHGFRKLAFFGLKGETWSQDRLNSLKRFCEQELNTELESMSVSHEERNEMSWPDYLRRIRSWIETLPKPAGVMVCSDQFAPDLLGVCREAGFSIPDQVSFVGVDNDLPFCEICQPQLSSVEPNHEQIGYQAAKTLQSILNHEPHAKVTEIAPRILHARQSSDATALNDPCLVKALRYIRSNACNEIGVDDVATAAGVSRSVLQRRFKTVLKKTVLDSILSVRLNRAKEMLTSTDLPLPDIAERCGFKHQEYLGYVFKKRVGTTPGQYRASNA